MKKMTGAEIRKKWLEFFEKNGHQIIESASLIPKNDNSLIWINSGVAALKNFFSGVETPSNTRITNSQKCLRTLDIQNVGITSRHHTLFEMLGNFSIGNYFKKEAIEFAYNLLVKEFEIEVSKLYITVFSEDEETYNKWISLGIKKSRIIKSGKERNFWDLGSGPCGPCTEIFYDRGEDFDPEKIGFKLFEEDIENDRFIEIWNIVFSEYNNDGFNNYSKLLRKNIDTGAGLERLACISQKTYTNFETDLFIKTIKIIEEKSKYKYIPLPKSESEIIRTQSFRVIVDHLRASIFAIADGVNPSGKDRGYILKKLIRRIFISFSVLETDENILQKIIKSQIEILISGYSYLKDIEDKILKTFENEKILFYKTMKEVSEVFKKWIKNKIINPKELFNLVETYGLPKEFVDDFRNSNFEKFRFLWKLTNKETVDLSMIKINFDAFDKYFEEHKKISKKENKSLAMIEQNNVLLNLRVKSDFLYDTSSSLSKVIKIFDESFNEINKTGKGIYYLVLDKTPLYATSGGQIHDDGKINGQIVLDVFKAPNGQNIHKLELNEKIEITTGKLVDCQINTKSRYKTTAAHSAEHLLHEALKSVVDKNIKQEGAFKSSEKLTFDFYHYEKLTFEQISNIESHINNVINSKINTDVFFVKLEEAIRIGAVALFEEKYKKIEGDLRVVKIGDISVELCGGTHVKNTSEIEKFMITKLDSKGSGSWRIEAIVTNENCFNYSQKILEKGTIQIQKFVLDLKEKKIQSKEFQDHLLIISNILKSGENVLRKFESALITAEKIYQKEIVKNENAKILIEVENFKNLYHKEQEYQEFVITNNLDSKIIHKAFKELVNEDFLKAFIAINISDNDVKYFAVQNEKTKTFDCQALIKALNLVSEGKGGGNFNFAQGGTKNLKSVEKLISVIKERNLN